ncbi:MAG: CdaR family protein [Defluviitaleaceae bacterium]|nr:CdaR family protein [Defluviitaleaceae bacterium]
MKIKNLLTMLEACLFRNLKWKAFAVISALSLWMLASWQADPPIESPFVRTLELHNMDHLTQSNIIILNEQALRNTQIVVQANHLQSVAISPEEVFPFVDLSNIVIPQDFTTPVSISVPVEAQVISPIVQGGYVLTPATDNVNINLDILENQQYSLEPLITQSPPENFSAGVITSFPQTITVTGPRSQLSNVYRVVANISLYGIQEETNFVSQVVVLDREDNDITNNFNLLPGTVSVTVPINALTSVPVIAPEIVGMNAIPPGFVYNGFTLSANSVQVMGDAAVVADIGQIFLETLDISGFTQSQTITVDIRDFLSDVTVYSNPEISIFIDISAIIVEPDPLPTTTVHLPSSQINVVGGMAVGVHLQEYIELTIAGDGADIDIAAITGTLNIYNLAPGVHELEVAITLPQGELVYPAIATVTIETDEDNYYD